MFLTGQKVVCIDGKFDLNILKFYSVVPREGQTYVVRGMSPGVAIDRKTAEIAVYLVGLHNPLSNVAPFRERGFRAERFRPLEETTDEEIMAHGQPSEKEFAE